MLINFLKRNAVDMLINDIPQNIAYYKGSDRWIDKYFEEKEMSSYAFSIGITVPDVSLTIGDSKTDYENSVKIYEAFHEKISPIQASDIRLWAYLAHETYWDYMHARWPIDVAFDDENDTKLESRIGNRYFFKASKGKAFVRQGIARLYWSAYLTYDDENENPYELTEYFLSKQDIFTVSTERSLARNKTILLSALRTLKENGDFSRAEIRKYFLMLNEMGGITILDSLSRQDAGELAKRTLDDMLHNI